MNKITCCLLAILAGILLGSAAACSAPPGPFGPPATQRPSMPASLPEETAARTPTASLVPTSQAEALASTLLSADVYSPSGCRGSYTQCAGPFLLRYLDYLYRYPDAPQRLELIEHLYDQTGGRPVEMPVEWLVSEWLQAAVARPFQAASGWPPGFATAWQHGPVVAADLDDNGRPDYLLAVNARPGNAPLAAASLYWVYEQDGQWQLERLEHSLDPAGLEVIPGMPDVNGDGRSDLAYTLTTCGAADCFTGINLLTRQAGGWQRLPVLAAAPAHNGGWSFAPGEDGRIELVMAQGGAGTAGFGPTLAYRLHFSWLDGAFTPLRISPAEGDPGSTSLQIQWADRLAASGRIAEARPVLNAVLEAGAQGEFAGKLLDYRPYVLFRLGMANLYLQNPADALVAWAMLDEEYPQTALAADASDLSVLIADPQAAWEVCDWYWQNTPAAKWLPTVDPPVGSLPYGLAYPFYVSTWCDPVLLVKLPTWELFEPLETQAGRRGLAWQALADNYDLNGDGQPDPLGLLDGRAWAFLSSADRWLPLDIESGLPLQGIPEPYQGGPDKPGERTVQVADLDGNGSPEVWVFNPGGLSVWTWAGSRFEGQTASYRPWTAGATYQPSLAGGEVRVAEVPASGGQAAPEWVFRLVGGELQQVEPPLAKPASAPALAAAVEALYRQRDPQRALQLLEGFTPQPAGLVSSKEGSTALLNDPDWQQAAACALRALAHEYLGDLQAARQAWQCVTSRYAGTAWAGLAQESLERLARP